MSQDLFGKSKRHQSQKASKRLAELFGSMEEDFGLGSSRGPRIQEEAMESEEAPRPLEYNHLVEEPSAATDDFEDRLRKCFVDCKIPLLHVRAILAVLRTKIPSLPASERCFLKIPNLKPTKIVVEPGQYAHYGIERQLALVPLDAVSGNCVEVDLGIDGFEVGESPRQTGWPIFFRVVGSTLKPMLAGLYIGNKDPFCSNQLTREFCREAQTLLVKGVKVSPARKVLPFKIRAIVCDKKAHTFICGARSCTFRAGCTKCTAVAPGGKIAVWPGSIQALRTDLSYWMRHHIDLHSHPDRRSELEQLGIGMISSFPIDPMHAISVHTPL